MFYAPLLGAKIPKAQKDSQVKQLFALLGSARVKAARRMLVKLTPGSHQSFVLCDSHSFEPFSFTNKITPNLTKIHI